MSLRATYFIGFVVVCGLLGTSVYLQVFDGFVPCPLCTLQRLTFGLIGFLFFIGMLIAAQRMSRTFVNFLAILASLAGGFFAGRQVWLQHFPPANSGECGVSLQYMVQALPINEVIQKIFVGTAECTQRGWEFLYLTMAEWSLVWFVILFFFSVALFFKGLKSQRRW